MSAAPAEPSDERIRKIIGDPLKGIGLSTADAPKEEPIAEPAKLPYDVEVGHNTFRKGVMLSTFVMAARNWHRAAYPANYTLTNEEKAANLRHLQGLVAQPSPTMADATEPEGYLLDWPGSPDWIFSRTNKAALAIGCKWKPVFTALSPDAQARLEAIRVPLPTAKERKAQADAIERVRDKALCGNAECEICKQPCGERWCSRCLSANPEADAIAAGEPTPHGATINAGKWIAEWGTLHNAVDRETRRQRVTYSFTPDRFGHMLDAFAKFLAPSIIADFLERTGQYVTNDASREAAIAAALASSAGTLIKENNG